MDVEQLTQDLWGRLLPAEVPDARAWILAALAAALVAVAVPVVWRRTRLAVTIVHELGHAVVGMIFGRRFTGFVVNGDMSGHAVTVGPRRGVGRVASTWSGYPTPAILGAVLVQLSLAGWSGAVLAIGAVILVVSLVFARSIGTVLAVAVLVIVLAVVWWWGGALAGAVLLLAIGVLLVLGALRHLGAVMAGGGRRDDPGQLAELTGLPAWIWNLGYIVVIAACTYWSWTALAPHLF